MRKRNVCVLSIVVLVFGVGIGLAGADDGDATDRTLSGHHFIPSDVLDSPFISTHVGSSTGIGIATLKYEGDSHSMAALGQWLDLQLGLGGWVALRGNITGTVMSGTSTDAALQFGANASYDVEGGATVKIFGTDWGILSASVDYSFNNGMQISPLVPIINSLNSGSLSSDGLFTETKEHQIKGGLQFAVGAHDFIGFWIDSGFAYGWAKTGDQSSSAGAVNAGGAISMDFGGITPVPVGLLGYYQLLYSLADGAEPVHHIGGGVFYTGRSNLVVGIEATSILQSFEGDASVAAVMAAFRLRYYW